MQIAEKCTVKFDFQAKDVETQLAPLCRRVLAEFQLPPLRLYCYFAQTDDSFLREKNGRYYRGFHISIEGRNELPKYLLDCFFHPLDEFGYEEAISWETMVAFDNLIYITRATSTDPTACVITFAHELQHFVQHGFSRKIAAANAMLYSHILRFDPHTRRSAIDIPHEREANIVSKRVGEQICGVDTVKRFAEEQVEYFASLARRGDEIAASEKARWEFSRDVPSSTQFNLQAETISLVEKFRPQLIAERFGIREGIDFSRDEWWL